MPVHNGGRYLQAAVESILSQSHTKLELILVDDHSTDNAIAGIKVDSRLRVIKCPAKGIVPALNEGIAHAKYPIVARMDADDIALPKRLEVQLDLLERRPDADIVGAQVELFSEESEVAGGYRRYQDWINQRIDSDDIARNFWIESCIPHPTAMMRRDVLLQLGGYRNSPWPEDYDLWCRAHLMGYKFAKPEGQILLKWRDYPSRTSRIEARYSTKQFLRCKARYLSEFLLRDGIKECMIWGSGPTGSKLHNYLTDYGINVTAFIDVNPKLVGRRKYEKPIHVVGTSPSVEDLTIIGSLCLVAVSFWGAREKITATLINAGYAELTDFIVAA